MSIDQSCDKLNMQVTTATTEQVKTFCDNIVAQLHQNKVTNDVILLSNVVTTLNRVEKAQFNDSNVLAHSLFILLRDTLVSSLRTWGSSPTMQQLAKDISSLISSLTLKFVNNFIDIFKQLLLYQPLLDELSVSVNKCAENIKDISEELVEVVNSLLFTYECLIRKRIVIQENTLMTVLMQTVARCFASSSYSTMLQQIGEQAELNVRQEFLFERCPLFLHQCRSQHRRHLLTEVRKGLLPLVNQRLPFTQVNKGEIVALGSICAVLFIRAHDMLNSEKYRGEYEKLLSHLVTMLATANQLSDKNNPTRIELIRELVEQLSNFIFTDHYIAQLKTLDLSSLLLKLVETIEDEGLQFQAYRILAAIFTEHDIKTLTSPNQIVTIFLKPIKDIINNVHCREPLDNILIALKSE